MKKNNKILITAIRKHGEELHSEIDNIINKLEADLDEINTELLTVITKKEDEIAYIISKISKNIADLKNLIASNDVSVFSAQNPGMRNSEDQSLKSKFPYHFSYRISTVFF